MLRIFLKQSLYSFHLFWDVLSIYVLDQARQSDETLHTCNLDLRLEITGYRYLNQSLRLSRSLYRWAERYSRLHGLDFQLMLLDTKHVQSKQSYDLSSLSNFETFCIYFSISSSSRTLLCAEDVVILFNPSKNPLNYFLQTLLWSQLLTDNIDDLDWDPPPTQNHQKQDISTSAMTVEPTSSPLLAFH